MNCAEFERNFVVRFHSLAPEQASASAEHLRPAPETLTLLGQDSPLRETGLGADWQPGVEIAYVQCQPGGDTASGSGAGWEIFLPVNGRWLVRVDGCDDVELKAWDVMIVPEGRSHVATNLSEETAMAMGMKS